MNIRPLTLLLIAEKTDPNNRFGLVDNEVTRLCAPIWAGTLDVPYDPFTNAEQLSNIIQFCANEGISVIRDPGVKLPHQSTVYTIPPQTNEFGQPAYEIRRYNGQVIERCFDYKRAWVKGCMHVLGVKE
jgi:hypothetical protein